MSQKVVSTLPPLLVTSSKSGKSRWSGRYCPFLEHQSQRCSPSPSQLVERPPGTVAGEVQAHSHVLPQLSPYLPYSTPTNLLASSPMHCYCRCTPAPSTWLVQESVRSQFRSTSLCPTIFESPRKTNSTPVTSFPRVETKFSASRTTGVPGHKCDAWVAEEAFLLQPCTHCRGLSKVL